MKIIFYIGTEAELIKIMPICRRLVANNIDFLIICNGQNYLANSSVFDVEVIKKAIFLTIDNIKFPSNKFIYRVLWMLIWFVRSIIKSNMQIRQIKNNDSNLLFFIHGDTISTLLGLIVAKINYIKTFHIESGLSSGIIYNPFPEELCRRLVTKFSDVRFTPSIIAENYAYKLNKKSLIINTYGNTMYDAYMDILYKKSENNERYFLLVLHRQETLLSKDLVVNIINKCLNNVNKNLKCYFVLHKQTKDFLIENSIYKNLKDKKYLHLVDRLPFVEFIKLYSNSEFILTDGGTNQEEAFYMGKPCYLLRRTTERNEGLNSNVKLPNDIIGQIDDFIINYSIYKKNPAVLSISPSEIVVEYIKKCV
jgi:UDP-N-acetylglucosamine 2-epimerase (non-hydrolysing)